MLRRINSTFVYKCRINAHGFSAEIGTSCRKSGAGNALISVSLCFIPVPQVNDRSNGFTVKPYSQYVHSKDVLIMN